MANPYSDYYEFERRMRYEQEQRQLQKIQMMGALNYQNELNIDQLAAIQSSQSTQKQQQNKLLLLLEQ